MAEKRMPDLDAMSVAELTALRDAAEAKRLEKLDTAREEVLAIARASLAELGLTLEEAMGGASHRGAPPASRPARKSGTTGVAPKYRSPGGDEWSGRGRTPKWLQAIEAEGRNREEFRV